MLSKALEVSPLHFFFTSLEVHIYIAFSYHLPQHLSQLLLSIISHLPFLLLPLLSLLRL
jgi:hypothetical protein